MPQKLARRSIVLMLFAALSWFAFESPAATVEPASGYPNIVLILTDDMGFGDIGVNGATRIKTPSIDAIAQQGVNFRQFYASANVCTPSRAGLLTGRYAIRTGLGYGVVEPGDGRGLPVTEETLAELVKRRNYRTMLIGKWHLGEFPQYLPTRHGFDAFYGTPHSNDMPNFMLYRDHEVIESDVQQSTLTQRYSAEAVRFIREHSDAPFFLMISHNMPHIPLFVSPPYAGKSDAGLYGDVIEELDASVGQVIETLKSTGVYDNTIIMFTSDNGPFFEGGTAGLKGGKGSGWEGGYRVPLVVSWPAGALQHGTRDAIAMNIDLLPTVAEILALEPAADVIDGKSLLSVLRGGAESPHQYLYYFNNEDIIGVRTKRWKLLTHAYYRRILGAFEKFDQLDGFAGSYELLLEAGPAGGEEYSYADRHPELVDELKAQLYWAREHFEPFRTRAPDATFPP